MGSQGPPNGKEQLWGLSGPLKKWESAEVHTAKMDHLIFNNGKTYDVAFQQNSLPLVLSLCTLSEQPIIPFVDPCSCSTALNYNSLTIIRLSSYILNFWNLTLAISQHLSQFCFLLLSFNFHFQPHTPCPLLYATRHNHNTTTVLQPIRRSTCIRRHPQLRTGWFCWSTILKPTCPCWRHIAYSD